MEDVTKSMFLNHSRAQSMEIAINFENVWNGRIIAGFRCAISGAPRLGV